MGTYSSNESSTHDFNDHSQSDDEHNTKDIEADLQSDAEELLDSTKTGERTPFVFHFDIGNVGDKDDEKYTVTESFVLSKRAITFPSGGCNDVMAVGSTRIG